MKHILSQVPYVHSSVLGYDVQQTCDDSCLFFQCMYKCMRIFPLSFLLKTDAICNASFFFLFEEMQTSISVNKWKNSCVSCKLTVWLVRFAVQFGSTMYTSL